MRSGGLLYDVDDFSDAPLGRIISSIEAGNGVGLAAEAFGYSFGTRVNLLPLTPEPRPISIGIAAKKGTLGMPAQRFWQCVKEAARK